MVGTGDALGRDHFAGERAESALHAVADNRTAYFLGDGKADPNRRVAVVAAADEQYKPGGRDPLASVGGEEIAALAKNA